MLQIQQQSSFLLDLLESKNTFRKLHDLIAALAVCHNLFELPNNEQVACKSDQVSFLKHKLDSRVVVVIDAITLSILQRQVQCSCCFVLLFETLDNVGLCVARIVTCRKEEYSFSSAYNDDTAISRYTNAENVGRRAHQVVQRAF
jgi:hypothetical protein